MCYNIFGDIVKITKVVLTGAPCSGKTTLIKKLADYYKNCGYEVFVLSECARTLIKNNVGREDMFLFEKQVVEYQFQCERDIDLKFKNSECEKAIVFYDRGIPDALTYVSDKQASEIMELNNTNLVEMWSRYDCVLMFESPNFDNYFKDSERTESFDEIVYCQQKLLSVWVGHPHFRFINYCLDFNNKFLSAVEQINCLLSNTENEVKYLVEFVEKKKLIKYSVREVDIEQIYLQSDVGTHRIRKRGFNGNYCYFETVKIRINDSKCYEYEGVISEEKYEDLKNQADLNSHPIRKKRYCFLYKSQYFELDVFPFWNDKALLELELVNDNQIIDLPSEIKVIEDVTKNKKYKNKFLASVDDYENY